MAEEEAKYQAACEARDTAWEKEKVELWGRARCRAEEVYEDSYFARKVKGTRRLITAWRWADKLQRATDEELRANVENQKVLIMVYQKFKVSNLGTLEQLPMEAESKSRDFLLQIFSMDFDEDTPLMLMRFCILIKKLQNFSSSQRRCPLLAQHRFPRLVIRSAVASRGRLERLQTGDENHSSVLLFVYWKYVSSIQAGGRVQVLEGRGVLPLTYTKFRDVAWMGQGHHLEEVNEACAA
uniref:Uncharacterized protein n=1 Tax=Aegilops tauschii TaxID=37682 RepID=M8B5M8_AEGTA